MEDKLKTSMASVFKIDISEIGKLTNSDGVANWDSVNHIKLIVALEDEFGVEFDEVETPLMTSYTVLFDTLLSKTGT